MTPYFKLSKDWANNKTVAVIGPDGLITHQIISAFTKQHRYPVRKVLISQAQDCLDLREQLATQSLFDEPEVWLIRLTQDSLLSNLKLNSDNGERCILIYGSQKKPAQCKWLDSLPLVIQSYQMKEPFLSRAITEITKSHQIEISTKATKWLSLCHQGKESLIPAAIEKIAHIYGSGKVSDTQIKPLLKSQSDYAPFELINAFANSRSTLMLMIKSTPQDEWSAIYWTLVSHWRKLNACAKDKQQLAKQFPWPAQRTAAENLIKQIRIQDLQAQHQTLVEMELSAKGMEPHPLHLQVAHWLLTHCVAR